MNILSEHYRDKIRGQVAWVLRDTIAEAIAHGAQVRGFDVAQLCDAYGVLHRFDFRRGGQDICSSRLNFTTDGKGVVTSVYCG